jgi:DNA-binding IclR family transcriptional regulator
MEPEERSGALARGRSTPRLLSTLTKIRKRGFEVHRSPITPGVTDIGFPVRGFDGKVLAALTVPYLHALDGSLPGTVEQTQRHIHEAARRISQSLGWTR